MQEIKHKLYMASVLCKNGKAFVILIDCKSKEEAQNIANRETASIKSNVNGIEIFHITYIATK